MQWLAGKREKILFFLVMVDMFFQCSTHLRQQAPLTLHQMFVWTLFPKYVRSKEMSLYVLLCVSVCIYSVHPQCVTKALAMPHTCVCLDVVPKLLKMQINCWFPTEAPLSRLHVGGSYRCVGLFVTIQPHESTFIWICTNSWIHTSSRSMN